jgi:hypothetical protein
MEKQKLPNATAVLILGILALLGTCCYGVIGVICGIIALVLASIDTKKYKINPDLYDNYSNLMVGKVLAIIALVLSVLFITLIVVVIGAIGMENLQDPEAIQSAMEEMFGAQ